MMKKFVEGFLLLMVCLLCTVAGAEGVDMTMLQDDVITIVVDEHGCLMQLENSRTGRQWLASAATGYRLTVNTTTGDIWKTVRGDTVTLAPEDARSVDCIREGQSLRFTHVHTVNEGTITVVQTWTLADGEIVLDTRIDNACTDAVVTDVVALVLDQISEAEDALSLLWPDKEGAMYPQVMQGAQERKVSLSACYPSPMSMQYLALYNGEESLYFAVHDASCEYKEFAFEVTADTASISCKQYPFVGAQQTKTLAATHIALEEGNWYACADRYRTFLLNNGFYKEYGEMVTEFAAIASLGMSHYKDRYQHYYINGSGEHKDMAQLSRENKSLYGTELTIYMGWHERGFDSRYPDYEFIEEYGGEEAFRQGVEEVHEQGGKVIPYLNLHIADTASNWYKAKDAMGQTNGMACAILTKYQSVLHEDYGTGLDYVAMCPMASAWQDAIVAAVRRLRLNGADGLWMDQLMEMPGNLCYNKAHGHTTPATAYAEGYGQLLARIDETMREVDGDYFYCCEGVCDAYIDTIDICGLMWARRPGSDSTIMQQVTRYTMPSKFMGLPSTIGNSDEAIHYAHAWIQGNGILCKDQNSVIKRYGALVEKYPEVYQRGRFMDVRGLGTLPEDVMAGILIAQDGTKAAIQLANIGSSAIKVILTLDGYGTVRGMCKAEGGTALDETADGYVISLPARSVSAVIVQLVP